LIEFFKKPEFVRIGSIGLVTQSILGLVLFPIIAIHSISEQGFIPQNLELPFFAYESYLIITLLIMSITQYKNTNVKEKKCHHCGGVLEIHQYKCKNPMCGKLQ